MKSPHPLIFVSLKASVANPTLGAFILLNLVLSTIAAMQAPIIMMSQNCKEEKDRKRAENDYLVNLKAEIKVRDLHRKMNLLMENQMGKMMEVQGRQLQLLTELNTTIQKQK